jgi:predicted PhzF superfamily epimerase YddE/YHI9
MKVPIYHVDAFTSQPFVDNPAAVCLLPEPQEESWMQDVAREMNLSETAFLSPEAEVRNLAPDFGKLARLPVRGVIVTSRTASPTYDFVSRFFAPASGVNEDPVTGSAHCCLGPFWAARLHKQEFVAFQAFTRGGLVRVRLAGERIKLGGQAVTVLVGELV